MIHLSRLLADRRTAIIERWTRRIGRQQADKDFSRSELRDHLPRFFDEILAALRAGEGPETPTAGEAGASTAHGEQRLRVGFDLAGVLREYQLLSDAFWMRLKRLAATSRCGRFDVCRRSWRRDE